MVKDVFKATGKTVSANIERSKKMASARSPRGRCRSRNQNQSEDSKRVLQKVQVGAV